MKELYWHNTVYYVKIKNIKLQNKSKIVNKSYTVLLKIMYLLTKSQNRWAGVSIQFADTDFIFLSEQCIRLMW